MEEKLYLGVGRKKITPEIGTCLYGYRPGLESTAVNDDLTATAFYFKQGDRCALLVSVTVGSVHVDITNDIFKIAYEKYGIPRSASIMNSTHTHSAPNLTGTYGWGDIDEKYRDEIFIPGVLNAIDEAVANQIPVRMAVATGESLIGINRRQLGIDNVIKLGQNPWGPFDPQMTILSFKGENGEAVANIIHYGAHGTAAGINTEISRDWPGVMIDVLEAETGAVTAFINGPEGDVGPRLSNGRTTGGGNIGYAMRHGAVAGQDAVRVYKSMGVYHTPKLSTYGGTLNIPLIPRISLDKAKAEHEKYKGEAVNNQAQMEKYYREVIESYENGYTEKEAVELEQNIIRLGDVAIVAFSFELFSEIGMRIKEYSEIPYILSLSNSNGSSGYFATESELCRGGYEIIMTTTANVQGYAPDADWHIVKNTLSNLEKTEN
jgi:hypothetical protein